MEINHDKIIDFIESYGISFHPDASEENSLIAFWRGFEFGLHALGREIDMYDAAIAQHGFTDKIEPTSDELAFDISKIKPTKCKYCKSPIYWVNTLKGFKPFNISYHSCDEYKNKK